MYDRLHLPAKLLLRRSVTMSIPFSFEQRALK
jgi:hypothetical protein